MIERLFAEGSALARSDGSRHELFPVAIPAAEGEALRERVIRERARQTIEIGLGYAVSTLFICEGLLSNGGSVRHVAIDPNQSTRFADCGRQFIDEAGLADIVEFHPEKSEIILPRLLAEGCTFDLAFVDGNHRFDAVFVDLLYLGRLVRPGGVIFVDDYQLPGIARAVSFFTNNLKWTLEDVSVFDELHRWAIVRTSRTLDTRDYRYFVDF